MTRRSWRVTSPGRELAAEGAQKQAAVAPLRERERKGAIGSRGSDDAGASRSRPAVARRELHHPLRARPQAHRPGGIFIAAILAAAMNASPPS